MISFDHKLPSVTWLGSGVYRNQIAIRNWNGNCSIWRKRRYLARILRFSGQLTKGRFRRCLKVNLLQPIILIEYLKEVWTVSYSKVDRRPTKLRALRKLEGHFGMRRLTPQLALAMIGVLSSRGFGDAW